MLAVMIPEWLSTIGFVLLAVLAVILILHVIAGAVIMTGFVLSAHPVMWAIYALGWVFLFPVMVGVSAVFGIYAATK